MLVGPVADALDGLSETDMQILSMIYVEELESPEIAERLGMKPSAVRMRHSRLLAKLQENEALKAVFEQPKGEYEEFFEDAEEYPFPEKQGWLVRGELSD